MSLLTIVQDACDKVGIPRLASVVGSASPDARQMLALANAEGRELSRKTTWQVLTKEKTFTSDATEVQLGDVPSDFSFMVNETFFNRSRQRRVIGPLTPEEWQLQKATTAQIYFDQYRFRGRDILLMPTPTAGDTYAFEYVSTYWAWNGDEDPDEDEYNDRFEADTWLPLLDSFAMTLGIVWRWKVAKGLDYAEDFRTYEIAVANLIARDGSRRTISMGGRHRPSGPVVIVPEGDWMA